MTVAELFVRFGFKTDKDSVKQAQNAVDRLRKSLARMALAYVSLSAIKGFAGLIESATETGTRVLSLAAQLGVSTSAAQELSYVFKQAGGDISGASTGISRFERGLRLFAEGKGSKDFAHTMEQIGVSQAQAAKHLTEPDGLVNVLGQVADHSKKVGVNMENSAEGQTLFGGRARGINAVLAQGNDVLQAQIKHLKDMGGVLSEDKLQNLKKANNAIQDLKTSLSAMFNDAVARYGPQLVDMLQRAEKWFERNRVTIEKIVGGALKAFGFALEVIGDIIEWVTDLIQGAFDGDVGAQAVLAGLAALILGVVIPALWAMVVPWLVMLGPVALVALAVAAVVAIVALLVKYGPQIEKALGDAWEWVKDKAEDFDQWLQHLPDMAEDAVTDAGNWITKKLGDAFDWVVNKAEAMWDAIKNIPVIGYLFKGVGAAAGFVRDQFTLDPSKLSANGLDVGVGPKTNVAGGNTSSATVNSNVTINVKSAKEAADAKAAIEGDHVANANRHAQRGLGGDVQ